MAISSAGYHEPLEQISEQTRDLHRALVSLQEELEAVDWYRQRADACADPALKEILLHNMREEIEHACMVLEWLRRNHPDFERHLKTYLFTEAPITEVEKADTGKSNVAPAGRRLTIGSLKQREGQ
jgi:ferritin-like protein